MKRFARCCSSAALLALVLAFDPAEAMAQGKGGNGAGGIAGRVLALEEGLSAEAQIREEADRREEEERFRADEEERMNREDGDIAEAEARASSDLAEADTRRTADEEEALAREEGDQTLQALLTQVTDVLCRAVQQIAGSPSAEAIALCGDRLYKRVFVTSAEYDGDLMTAGGGGTGLEGGDNICNDLAQAAGLSGTYIAWLSSSVINASDRLPHATVPYVRTDGTKVADDLADLVDCGDSCLDAPIDHDELGASIYGLAWTGSDSFGVRGPINQCLDWTSSAAGACQGVTNATDGGWTCSGWRPCTDLKRLYCFQN